MLSKYYLLIILLIAACGTAHKRDQEIFSEQQREVLDPIKDIELEVEKTELEQTLIVTI